jgi:hypothetical protein
MTDSNLSLPVHFLLLSRACGRLADLATSSANTLQSAAVHKGISQRLSHKDDIGPLARFPSDLSVTEAFIKGSVLHHRLVSAEPDLVVAAPQCFLFGEGEQCFADTPPLSVTTDGNVLDEQAIGSRTQMENGEQPIVLYEDPDQVIPYRCGKIRLHGERHTPHAWHINRVSDLEESLDRGCF